ncbi:triple tyrosine motif-containing protein [Hwangdonia lutea]|uniref:Triple tyrosine motif-containing protein n=1 Tax=Hwangdonia lutea TaxID=3075823 RepID=A0AA97EPY9_9FLAO|nr:triple tyrosine motif-containing protein [Hwangdonia sp. SCSIO 19198]WOD44946.1 triple tyrosine motif-containing protein [Hwangdonia sp. SCSIO 19198]
MKILKSVFLILLSLLSFSQELPPIEKFSAENYLGDNQNWMLSQASNNFIYVANNKGLLEYNGAEWTTYASPNNTIIRAVNVIKDKIYTGCYAEFGYWNKNEFGTLNYLSLSSKLDKKMLEDEQIWNIIEYNEWVVFQSNAKIYFYNSQTETFKIVKASNIIYKTFKVKNQIYYHVANEGIYTIEEGKPKLIIDSDIVKSGRVINMFNGKESLIIITRNAGFYKIKNNQLIPWNIKADAVLNTMSVFSSIQLKDKSFMIGTISDGVLHISENGTINYQITQKKGLSNNTVLSLFEDNANNVWAGLDNGINCINVKSAIKTFFDYDGVLGTVYTTQVFKNVLYIGSNQGLFYRRLKADDDTFRFIEGTAGQVWDLFNYNDEYLFCGHHLGTFLIVENKANKISSVLGAWTFKRIPEQQNLLLQGNYNGLFILEKVNNFWRIRNKVEGFKNSSRYLEIDDENQIWVSHEYKGVFKLKLNDSLTKVQKLDMETSLPLGKNSSLIKYKNDIHYASEEGLFIYNTTKNAFQRDSILSKIIKSGDYISGKLVVDKNEKLWAFSKDNISFVENDDVTNQPVINNIPIPSKLRKGVLGYENISLINRSTYVLGTANGYMTLDLSKFNDDIDYEIFLNSIAIQDVDDNNSHYALNTNGVFNYKQGLLSFNYSVPEYHKYLNVKYQYMLEGHSNKWSKWTENTQVTFENLSFGDYTFMARAKVGNALSKNTLSYSFTVSRPWYLSNTALSLYVLLLLIIILITHKAYKRYYSEKFKHEQMENEQMIMQIKNEKLNQDIDNKNRELAISTMSIIKKNRVLNKIKKELKKTKHIDNNTAIELINSNLNDTKDWSFFEQAFNNADKDFLEKIKSSHPDLTPNDLRFCAYLRLNLSSKEMAPLLNISIKSVETKRYRLRKKLGLEHDDGLVEYILKF